MPRLMIIRKSAPVIATLIGVAGTSLLPIASADTLSNGLTVTCTQDSDVHVTCIIGGCPRVNGDYVVDAVHVMRDGGGQQEYGFKCINGETVRYGFDLYAPAGDYKIGVQGCRKQTLSKDWCGPWADYDFKAAPKPAAPPAPAPAQAPAPNANKPVRCTGQGGGYDLPPGSDCSKTPNPNPPAAPAPVTNAIQLSFGPPQLGSITATVTNSSNLTAKCTYDSTPFKNHIDFTVNPNGSTNLPIKGFNTGTSYHVVVSCHDASGKQTQEIGHAETNVTF